MWVFGPLSEPRVDILFYIPPPAGNESPILTRIFTGMKRADMKVEGPWFLCDSGRNGSTGYWSHTWISAVARSHFNGSLIVRCGAIYLDLLILNSL